MKGNIVLNDIKGVNELAFNKNNEVLCWSVRWHYCATEWKKIERRMASPMGKINDDVNDNYHPDGNS